MTEASNVCDRRYHGTLDGQVVEVFIPGQGRTLFTYDDDALLSSVIHPSGVVQKVLKRASDREHTLELEVNRHDGGKLKTFFLFDDWGRLSKRWDSASGTSETIPREEYAYLRPSSAHAGRTTTIEWLNGSHSKRTEHEWSDGGGRVVAVGREIASGMALSGRRIIDDRATMV